MWPWSLKNSDLSLGNKRKTVNISALISKSQTYFLCTTFITPTNKPMEGSDAKLTLLSIYRKHYEKRGLFLWEEKNNKRQIKIFNSCEGLRKAPKAKLYMGRREVKLLKVHYVLAADSDKWYQEKMKGQRCCCRKGKQPPPGLAFTSPPHQRLMGVTGRKQADGQKKWQTGKGTEKKNAQNKTGNSPKMVIKEAE